MVKNEMCRTLKVSRVRFRFSKPYESKEYLNRNKGFTIVHLGLSLLHGLSHLELCITAEPLHNLKVSKYFYLNHS
jgi:hypothetical protein